MFLNWKSVLCKCLLSLQFRVHPLVFCVSLRTAAGRSWYPPWHCSHVGSKPLFQLFEELWPFQQRSLHTYVSLMALKLSDCSIWRYPVLLIFSALNGGINNPTWSSEPRYVSYKAMHPERFCYPPTQSFPWTASAGLIRASLSESRLVDLHPEGLPMPGKKQCFSGRSGDLDWHTLLLFQLGWEASGRSRSSTALDSSPKLCSHLVFPGHLHLGVWSSI